MPFFDDLEAVPQAVRLAVGDAMVATALIRWWRSPSPLLHGSSPQALWEAGKHQDVLDHIARCKVSDAR